MPYPVVDTSSWAVAGIETDGLTEHFWLVRPRDDRLWLYKEVTVHGLRRQGEDWVEKLASALAERIGIPRADVELATRGQTAGCVVRDVKPHQWQLFSGADLLSGLLGPTYDPHDRLATGHKLENIKRVLSGYEAPPGVAAGAGLSAFDYFAGYLALDALIANRDRHARNWGVLQPPPASNAADALCPSFDHASGLGFGLSDVERRRWLEVVGVEAWARRGDAKCFEHGPRPWPSLVEVAVTALRTGSVSARRTWRAGLEHLEPAVVYRVVADLPSLSQVTRTFTADVIRINRVRLLQEAW